jgi:hypothetical protein
LANNYRYGYAGPPFNFLGHFCTTQQEVFNAWVRARKSIFPAIQQFHQIRAAQMRKTAGVLERFYATLNDDPLKPSFDKNSWKPGAQGHFNYTWREDHLPMIAMAQVKDYLREQFVRQDDAVFQMNHLRTLIEKQEDKAEKANEALTHPRRSLEHLLTKINSMFQKPEYQAVLVKDQTDVYPAGSTQPRFRVHQLDPPTPHELELAGRVANPGDLVNLKENIQQ